MNDLGLQSFFQGTMDELVIFDRALSSSEILDLANAAPVVCTPNWQCDSYDICGSDSKQYCSSVVDSNSLSPGHESSLCR